MTRSVIISTGSYLPARVLTNADLEKVVDTSDEWITQRTGIKERRIAASDEPTSAMAARAAGEALAAAGIEAPAVDGIIVATSTPDQTFPSVAVRVQAALGLSPGGIAFDVQAVCSGFIYALSVADAMLRNGQCRRMLVVGAEKMSAVLDWDDRTTCVLFGDGAGAVVLEAQDHPEEAQDRGIISTHLHADGRYADILYTSGGTSTTGESGYVVMEGREVFRHAVTNMARVVEEALASNNIAPEQIDWLVPHQANIRIIEGAARKLGMGMDKVVVTVDRHGNTSAASIPLALDEAVRNGKIRRGDLLLLEALGAGLTWGAALVRF